MFPGLDLYPEVTRKLRLAGSSIFLHVGALHRTRTFDEDLQHSLPTNSEIGSFRLDSDSLLPWIDSSARRHIAVIYPDGVTWPVERTEERLSNLHKPIEEARFRGASFLFVSQRPLACYPGMVGSSVLVDSEKVWVKPLDDEVARARLEEAGVAAASAGNLLAFAAGSRALLDIFSEVDSSPLSGNEKRRLAETLEGALAERAYAELGCDIMTVVDTWVFEGQLGRIAEDDVPNDTIRSALVGSGLIRKTPNLDDFDLLPFKNRDVWIAALADCITSVIEPPESWTKVTTELFAFERDLRQALSARYAAEHGLGWRTAALEPLTAEILELARRDAIPAAHSLEELRNPLDWLQLSRLLVLAEDLASTGGFRGLHASDWQRLGRDVLPIRHRIAHMRLVRPGDLDTVRRSRRFVEVRRKSSSDQHVVSKPSIGSVAG